MSDDLVVDTYAAYLLYANSTPRYEPNDGLTEDTLAIIRMYAAEILTCSKPAKVHIYEIADRITAPIVEPAEA